MNWLLISVIAYFLLALEIVLDKFLLSSGKISHPSIYAFYSGVAGLFALAFSFFGFHLIPIEKVFFSFLAGIFFIYGMLSLFFAVKKSEASRVLPIVGAVVPIITFILAVIFLKEDLGIRGMFGIIVLIFGGLFISLEIGKGGKPVFFEGFATSLLAGFFLAVSAVMIKSLYSEDNFLNVFIWTRTGAFLGTLSFLFVPTWRKCILNSLFKFKKPENEQKKSGISFLLAKSLGGTGSFLKENATSMSLASVTVINALVSLEYVFIFILGLIFSFVMPSAMREKISSAIIIQKMTSIIIIAFGFALVAKIR